ncbi:hypothetical protein C7N43_19960 [Sphingobacteriales bacterium UPWRP_1]|nr:hypothetical protein BVG80_02680 [Sphingobacteriales bacterium TSM_CSM]PSJ75262.1 hypothetical protein C7N43_19960 [Sphingobacteriales bacterium UPWRP_1]
MKIRIISEKKFEPVSIKYPVQNPDFFDIQQPPTNTAKPRSQRLQIFMHKKVHELIWQHAGTDNSNEVGGALLGYYAQHNEQQFLLITDVLNQPTQYFASQLMIKFTTTFYTDLENFLQQVNAIYPQVIRLGLYHTHPNYGIFMSKTDIADFKRTHRELHHIVLIADPIQLEDGVFYWETPPAQSGAEQEISAAAGYFIYDTHNPAFAPHTAVCDNKPLLTCNPLLFEPNSQNKQTGQESSGIPPALNPVGQEKTVIAYQNITSLPHHNPLSMAGFNSRPVKEPTTMTCPLYNIRYACSSVPLKQYVAALSGNMQHSYPYHIFFPQEVKQQLAGWVSKTGIYVAALHGVLGYDTLKQMYFLYISGVTGLPEATTNSTHDMPSLLAGALPGIILNYPDVVGWLVVNNKSNVLPYQYFDVHKLLFTQNHCLGIVLKTGSNNLPDFENATLVAYDAEAQKPYNFYRHFFLYRQPFITTS